MHQRILFILLMGAFMALQAHTTLCFHGGNVLRDHKWNQEDLWIRNGRIVEPQSHADQIIDAHGSWIAPGLIDIQINGAYGEDFSRADCDIAKVCLMLPRHGVTGFLPTIITSPFDQYKQLVTALNQPVTAGAKVLGVHLEGPCLSEKQPGCHPVEFLTKTLPALEGIRLLTLAPEVVDVNEIAEIAQRGTLVAAGHTMATYEEMQKAADAGVRLVTHLGNATRPFHHREPGVYGAALLDERLFVSVIVDGHHLHPATVDIIRRLVGERLILVSDAMPAVGLDDGTYPFGEIDVVVADGRATVSESGQLAGSVATLDLCVRNLIKLGVPSAEALEAASLHPAQLLGLTNKGTLEIGADADLVLMDKEFHVVGCWIDGQQQNVSR